MRLILFLLLVLPVPAPILAQQKTSNPDSAERSSYGEVSLNLVNNNVYFGRADSINTPYITPRLAYYNKSGFFAEATFSYLVRHDSSRVDAGSIGAGYDFTAGNFSGEIMLDKYFYNSKSTNVKAEIQGDFSFSGSYDFGFAEINLLPGVNFGSKSDWWFTAGISHTFKADSDRIEITPKAELNGSTRNFYSSYFGKRRFIRPNGQTGTISASVKDASQFKFMDYELSLPVYYTAGRFTLGATPVLAVPLNPAEVTVIIKPAVGPAITRTNVEKTKNNFYFSLDLSYKF